MKKLNKNTQYCKAGEYFSKLLFLEASTKQENIIHIVSSLAEQKKYLALSRELGFSYTIGENYQHLANLNEGEGKIYSFCIDDLEYSISLHSYSQHISFSVGDTIESEETVKQLIDLGYEFQEYEKENSFYKKGDSLHITLQSKDHLIVSLWGDEIESILLNGSEVGSYSLHSLKGLSSQEGLLGKKISLGDFLNKEQNFCILDNIEFHHQYDHVRNLLKNCSSFDMLSTPDIWENTNSLEIQSLSISSLEAFKDTLSEKEKVIKIYTRHSKMLGEFLRENNFGHIEVIAVNSLLFSSFEAKGRYYICDDILQNIFIKKRSRKKLSADVDLLLKIRSGDFVVHIDHGIGMFGGIVKKQLGKVEKEYLELSYKDNDKLFVPITEVGRVSKYVGVDNPQITPLSGKFWERKLQKVHEDIKEIAEGILKNFAERKLRKGDKNIFYQNEIANFQASFPHTYTYDQNAAIEDIFTDMQSDKNMDRLVVGDVGFGKTEIAFNAAFMSLLNQKQVILISPLVVLAHEHFNKATERFAGMGYNIEILTRLQSQAHTTRVLKGLKEGNVHMVIGTHKLLSDKIHYKNLGCMIVDEEHKFGVSDKEKIKEFRSNIDILSLSATPIPRSLNLALSGVRDISLLKTPPSGRKSIETSIIRMNEALIESAGKREFSRGGQIFFVHNRVSNIEVIKKQLLSIFPKKKIIITHGQLPGEELENRIIDFKNKKYDILLSTTVIENGIDFSNVNTIFINECQSFGISQIHQLRGRVGRSSVQGYCYLLYKKNNIDGEAAKRLQTIVDYSYLGAGFELAMKDLEIRGGGDILGVRQSGQKTDIGVSLFLKMLEEKIQELKEEKTNNISKDEDTKKKKSYPQTKIDILLSASIPDEFFLSETDKLNFYREIESLSSAEDLEYLKSSLFENISETKENDSIDNLFLLLELGLFSRGIGIESIKKVGVNYQLDFHESCSLENIKGFLERDKDLLFFLVTPYRLRCGVKSFANEKLFLQYLLRLLQGKLHNSKMRLAKKST